MNLPDEKLVAIVNGRGPIDGKVEAALILEDRYRPVLRGRVGNLVRNPARFLAAVKCGRIEDFCADVLGKAIRTYRRGHKTKFSTWVYELLTNEIISGKRLRMPPAQPVGPDGRDLLEDRPETSAPPDGLESLAFGEAIELARACLRAMDPRWRRVFVWGHLLRMSVEEIRGVWPRESADNVKQLRSRAAERFADLWYEKGGARAESLLENLAGAVAETLDPRRIRDPRAREAYLLWVRKGDLAVAARELKMKPERLRSLLLEAMHDLFDQMFRGGGREADLERLLDLVRAAFGFAPAEAAARTLGSLVQSRLAREEDYDAACRELGLGPAALRALLADEFEPEKAFFARLSAFLALPADRLRALPRRPAGGTRLLLRSRAGFDDERFRKRVLEWIPR